MYWRYFVKSLRKKYEEASPQKLLLIAVIILAVLGIIIYLIARPRPDLTKTSAELSDIREAGAIRIGVQDGAEGFAKDGSGLEMDIAQLICDRVFEGSGTAGEVEYVQVDSKNISAKLAAGEVDAVMARAVRVSDTAVSSTYYVDKYDFMVRSGESVSNLQDAVIGVVNASESESALNAYAEKEKLTLNKVSYASYPELVAALKAGKVTLAAMERLKISQYAADDVACMNMPYGDAHYAVLCPESSEGLIKIIDDILKELKENGQLSGLILQNNLIDYMVDG
jgi:ABC-type amino acid transport substrate-binding protein